MKKILSILMILVLVGGVAFAQLTPEVKASAAVNWGIDLGSGSDIKPQHGFENKFTANVLVPLYKGKLSSKTEGNVHMEFDMDMDLSYEFDDAKSNSTSSHIPSTDFALVKKALKGMSASVHFFGGYMNILGRPDFSTNYAEIWGPIVSNSKLEKPKTEGDITGFGTKLGYKNDDILGTGLKLDAGLKFGSNGSWKAEKVAKKDESVKYELKDLKENEKVKKDEIYYKNTVIIGYDANGGIIVKSNPTAPEDMPDFTDASFTVTADHTITADEAGKYVKKIVTKAEAEKPPFANKYAIGFDFSLGYDKWVTFDFGINATFDPVVNFGEAGAEAAGKSNPNKPYIGMGFKLGSKPAEGLALKFAMDTLMNVGNDSKTAFDLLFDTSYKWVKAGVYYGNKFSGYTGSNSGKETIGDMAAMLAFKSEDSGDTNFLKDLAFGVEFRLNHILNHIDKSEKDNGKFMPMGFKTWINYKHYFTDSIWIKPYTTVWGENNCSDRKDGSSGKMYFGVAYEIGTTFAPMEKVEIDAKWSHGTRKATNKYEGYGMIEAPANHKNHNGTFVIGVTVKY